MPAPGKGAREPQKSLILYVLFWAQKSIKKRPPQGATKITFKREILQLARFPRSDNKISNPFERLFVDGSKGAVQRQRQQARQRHKRKRFSKGAAFGKQCGSINRVNGQGKGEGWLAP